MKEKQRELLLQLRSDLVGQLHTQPYTIYQDSVIEELLKAQPRSIEELSRVKGFPKEGKRIKGFGEAIVSIFTGCDKIQGIEVVTDSYGKTSIGVALKKLEVF